MHLAGAGQVEAEHALGARVEVADAAVRLGHQHALVDRTEGAEGVFHRLPRQCVVGTQAALLAQQAEQGEQGQGRAENEQQQLAGLQRQHLAAQARGVEQGLDLPVAVVQRQRGNALQLAGLACRRRRQRRAQHGVAAAVLQQPGQVGALLGQPVVQRRGTQAHQPMATRLRVFDKQQDQPAIDAHITEMEALAGRQLPGLGGARSGVEQLAALCVIPGQAVQGRIDAVQAARQVGQLCLGRRRFGVGGEKGAPGLGLEAQHQAQVVGQLAGVLLAAHALRILQLARLLMQLPQQQAEHQRHQQCQCALQRAARGAGQRVAGGAGGGRSGECQADTPC